MKETFILCLPNRAGVFLKVCAIVAQNHGNICRMSYNKGIDMNTVFLDVSGDEKTLEEIRGQLDEGNYLAGRSRDRQVILVELRIVDGVGAVMPVLEAISHHHVNISFINYQQSDDPVQTVRMGLFIDHPDIPKQLLEDLSGLCEVSMLNYDVTDRSLDGSVFYISFAHELQQLLDLSEEQTEQVLIQSNRIMQMLDEDNKAYLKTFDYINRFAKFIRNHRKENFRPRISRISPSPAEGLTITVIEPPFGSNTYIMEYNGDLLFVDCGFSCCREEMLEIFRRLCPDFDRRRKEIVITHADIDHTGLLDLFDKVYLSQSCCDNFENERLNLPNYREQNSLHQPYILISKIVTGYQPPSADHFEILGERHNQKLLCRIGKLSFGKWEWMIDEGMGGHVRGETVISCPELRVVFSGDIYVNIKHFSDDQREFNLLAPYLMTGVDEDGALAKQTRSLLLETFSGYTLCPGHGPILTIP